jgi:hypothetical protein
VDQEVDFESSRNFSKGAMKMNLILFSGKPPVQEARDAQEAL